MNWLSNLLTPIKGNELKPTFGQEYLYATGYDDLHEEVYFKNNPNIRETIARNEVKINIEVISNFSDYAKYCTFFDISHCELLKLIANRSNRMEEILNFFSKNINGHTLVCNIYMVKQEAIINYHSKSQSVTRQISKFILGHHIILCVPLKEPIQDIIGAKATLTSLLMRDDSRRFADYFLPDSAALFDYFDTVEKPAFEILNEINDYKFQNNISLFVELPKLDKNDNYSNSLALSMILKLKKLNYLIEEKFSLETNFLYGKEPIPVVERNKIAEAIIRNIKKLGDLDVSTFPPPLLPILYNHCKVYERQYCLSVYEKNYVPVFLQQSEEYFDIAYRTIKNIPLKRIANVWLLKAKDENARDIYEKYLVGKWCIVITKTTKHLAADFSDNNVVVVLTEETKWKDSAEPVLIFNGIDEYLLGMIEPPKLTKKNTCKNGIVFRCACSCENDNGISKAWICAKCKFLFRTIDVTHVYCECGVFKVVDSERRCFKCALKEDETSVDKKKILKKEKSLSLESLKREQEKPPSLPPTPITLAPPSTPIATTPTTSIPKHIVPVKKEFNILFIGQSGAGKSMLVNSIYNYLTYNFDEVSKAETVDCILPCQFQLQTPDFKKIVFKAGPEDKNENHNDSGESVTQYPKVYNFKTENYNCQVIDTRGLGDTRGAKQDEYNLNLIRNAIIEIKELHAICFVIPSNISKLTTNFEVNMRDLLSLFPKIALKNVFFFFTYANSTFFTIGDTRTSLEEFISTFEATNNAKIPFNMENVCCVDSEAFMYFIATKQGHKYQNRDLESFRISWDKSKEAIETFLAKMEKVNSIKSADILMTYEMEQIGTMLRNEKSDALKSLISNILTSISQISMTSKFNLAKRPSTEPLNDSKKPELFHALEICQKHAEDLNLKQLIKKLVEAYGPKMDDKNIEEVEKVKKQNVTNIKKSTIESDKAVENGSKPEPPKRYASNWPCKDRLNEIAERLAKEWQNEKISVNSMEHMLNVQIAGSLQQKDINKMKLKDSLDILLMEVKGDLYVMMEKLIAEFNFKNQ